MSESARTYQAHMTGAPPGYAYRVKTEDQEVDFDGFEQGVLLEVKCPGYAQWITRRLDFLPNFKGAARLLDQASRQARAANGRPIRWIVAEEKLAGPSGSCSRSIGSGLRWFMLLKPLRPRKVELSNDRIVLRGYLLASPA